MFQKLTNILRNNEQLLHAFREPVDIFWDEQQTLGSNLACPCKEIPVLVLLIAGLFDAADLLESEEHLVIQMPRRKVDGDPCSGDDIGCWISKESKVLIRESKPNEDDKQLPER